MNFKPNPLLYGANKNFLSSFRLAIRMKEYVDFDIFFRSVEKAMVRYPYFRVLPKRDGEELVLHYNENPLPIFSDDRTVALGGAESRGHLISFGCKDKTIFIDASHYLTDGMGVDPLIKTLIFIYASERYGIECGDTQRIRMPDCPACEGEYAYPFYERTIEFGEPNLQEQADAYILDSSEFDDGGLYAYHLHIPQTALMKTAKSTDGSPVSFISVLLYRALHRLDSDIQKPIVAHVQHQYRAAVNAPICHHSLVDYIPVSMSARMNKWDIEKQNTVVRGQVILKGTNEADIASVNRLMLKFTCAATFDERKAAMASYAENSIIGKTFGISYVGKMDWCGLERFVDDLHVYIGEKHTKNMLLIEVMTVGEDFSLTFMQSGKGRKYLDAFMNEISLLGIPSTLVGEERYKLCETDLL